MFFSCNPKLVWLAQPEIRPAEKSSLNPKLVWLAQPKIRPAEKSSLNPKLVWLAQPETCLAGSTRNSTSRKIQSQPETNFVSQLLASRAQFFVKPKTLKILFLTLTPSPSQSAGAQKSFLNRFYLFESNSSKHKKNKKIQFQKLLFLPPPSRFPAGW